MHRAFKKIRDEIYRLNDYSICSLETCNTLDLLDEFVEDIQKEYNIDWVPIEKGNPKWDLRCFVTIIGVNSTKSQVVCLNYSKYADKWFWPNKQALSRSYKILAWRPCVYPEPYQP